MFKKHTIQLRVVKTPNTTPETEEQKLFAMTEDEIIFAKYIAKNVALYALGYMVTKVVLNTAADLVIKHL